MIQIIVRKFRDVTILYTEKDRVPGDGKTTLGEVIRKELQNGSRKIVLSLWGFEHIDSCSIGDLASAQNEARQQGCEIKLAALKKNVSDALEITKNDTLFDIHYCVITAIRCFGGEHIGCSLKRL